MDSTKLSWIQRNAASLSEHLWAEDLHDHLLAEVMVLKLKQNGKELDPKYFDEKEKMPRSGNNGFATVW